MFAKLSSVRRGALVDEPKDEGDIESALTKFSEDIAQEAPPSHPQQACDARVNVISRETTGLSNNSEPSEPSHREVGHRMISFNLENEEEPPAQKNIPRPPSLGIMSFREGSSSRRKSLDPINSTAVFGEALVHRAFSKRIISTNLVSSKVSGSDDKLLSRFGAGSPSGIGSRQGSCRSLDACSISSSSAALATRTKLKQRGPPESLMGVHDCPIPLSRKEDWSDPKYCSNRIVPVRIQTHIIDLKEIDTVRQEFVAVVWVQMKWRESLPEGTNCNKQLSEKELTALGIGKWRPTLTFIGINHDFKSDENVRPSHSPGNSYVTLFMRYNISGTFARRMELHFFPFDKQRLRIKAILWGCPEAAGGVTLSEETENEPGGRTIKFEEGANEIYAEGFIQTNAFVLYPNLFLKQGLTRPLYEDQIQYTTLSINCLMERRVNFYFYNFVTPIFLLGMLQMVTFLLPVEDLASRMNINILVILTTVAFRFSMASYLPISAYLTMLDRYMLSSVFFQSIIAVQNVIVYLLVSTSLTSESTAVYTFNIWTACAAGWLIIHLSIPFLHRISYQRQDKIIMNDETDFHDEKELEKSPI